MKTIKKLNEKKLQLILLVYTIISPSIALATGAGSADAKWNSFTGFITPWITRLGGLIVLIGAVEFGIAFKGDDAEGKTKGGRTVIAGCIVFAVGMSSSTFL